MKTATILLKREEQEKIKSKVSKILENYDSFVLADITDEQIQSLRKEGFKVSLISEIEKIQIGSKVIDTTQLRYDKKSGKILPHSAYLHVKEPGKREQEYILQFIGPIKSEWQKKIQEIGGVLGAPLSSYSYVVLLDEEARKKAVALYFVRWIGHYDPSFKTPIDQQLKTLTKTAAAVPYVPNKFSVSFHTQKSLEAARRPISKELGGDILEEYGTTIICSLPSEDIVDQLKKLTNIPGVRSVNTVKTRKLQCNIATNIMCNLENHPSNLPLTGRDEIIGIADSGIDTGKEGWENDKIHEDFKGRIVDIVSWKIPNNEKNVKNPGDDDGSADISDGHGTHVAGCVLASGQKSNNLIHGLAVEAKLYFQAVEQKMEWTEEYIKEYQLKNKKFPPSYYLAGIPAGNPTDLFERAYDADARIHTNSWANSNTEGIYDDESKFVDEFVWKHKEMVILFSAGNEGHQNEQGNIFQKSITSPATAKNCVAVGASENYRENFSIKYKEHGREKFFKDPIASDKMANNPSHIAGFSARGPCKDGRFKPDVIAPGTYILSTRSSMADTKEEEESIWSRLPPDDPTQHYYIYMGGTSMSTPLTAGAVALIRQYLREKKGYLFNWDSMSEDDEIRLKNYLKGYRPDFYVHVR